MNEKRCETCDQPMVKRKTESYEQFGVRRFCSQPCRSRGATTDIVARFWSKVVKTDTCWLWTGALGRGGYPRFAMTGGSKTIYAHRFSYELAVGPIPEGLTIDHVWPRCINRHCVRPGHLEAVPFIENRRRAAAKITHCPAGHSYAEHAYVHPVTGRRACKLCPSIARLTKKSRQVVTT